jgi:hypothetical protein
MYSLLQWSNENERKESKKKKKNRLSARKHRNAA